MLKLSIFPRKVAQKDYGFNINFAVLDENHVAFDLTSFTTVKFKAWPRGAPSGYVVYAAATKDAGTGGTGHYTVQKSDFTYQDKVYFCAVELSNGSEIISTEADQLYLIETPQTAY